MYFSRLRSRVFIVSLPVVKSTTHQLVVTCVFSAIEFCNRRYLEFVVYKANCSFVTGVSVFVGQILKKQEAFEKCSPL